MKEKLVCFVVIILLLGVVYWCSCKKSKEGYADAMYINDLDNTMLQRPTFTSNLDPSNMNLRFDPHIYGGNVRGQAPPVEALASTNKQSGMGLSAFETIANYKTGQNYAYQSTVDTVGSPVTNSVLKAEKSAPTMYGTSIERFSPLTTNMQFGDQSYGNSVNQGSYQAGMNDAASFVNYSDFTRVGGNNGLNSTNKNMLLSQDLQMKASKNPASQDYQSFGTDFSYLAAGQNAQAEKMQQARKYKASLDNAVPNTLEYTLPSELLPAPDMRQSLMRDPSDPTNFMYDRTVFAPLKRRNINNVDFFRGDLDIVPIKTGWFDSTQTPQVDLVKGYFGYFNDIEEFQDLQDVAYSRTRDTMGNDTSQPSKKLDNLLSAINKDMTKPKLVYASPPPLDYGPLNKSYTEQNPWFNDLTATSNPTWAKP
jgi:hypothetical protein